MTNENRKTGRLDAPKDFPQGRLAAGELAALVKRSEERRDFLGGATYGLPPERCADINRMALDLGIPPGSEEWVIHLASGHSSRLAERIPGEIDKKVAMVEEHLRRDFETRMSMLASLDDAVVEAGERADAARDMAEKAAVSVAHVKELFEAGTDAVFSTVPSIVKAAGAEQARAVLEPFVVALERRSGGVAMRIKAETGAFSETVALAAEKAGGDIATSCDAAADRFYAALRGALKKTVAGAARTKREDRTTRLIIAAISVIFVLLVGGAGVAGYKSGELSARIGTAQTGENHG